MLIESPFLTLGQAAIYLGYSRSSLYKKSEVPRFKLPGSKDWRYDREELLAWAKSSPDAQKRMNPKSEPAELMTANTSALRQVPRRRSSRYR